MNVSRLAHRRRTVLTAALVACVFALVALVSAAPALAKQQKSCAQAIVEDWYDNQRIDRFYPIHCYHDAINSLGPDVKNYTNLPDAILRALAYRTAGEKDPGNGAEGAGGVKPISYRHTADIVSALPSGSAAGPSSGSSPSSIPIPLIVLAGLAGVLLIAGGAGYAARRLQGRRGGPPSDE